MIIYDKRAIRDYVMSNYQSEVEKLGASKSDIDAILDVMGSIHEYDYSEGTLVSLRLFGFGVIYPDLGRLRVIRRDIINKFSFLSDEMRTKYLRLTTRTIAEITDRIQYSRERYRENVSEILGKRADQI